MIIALMYDKLKNYETGEYYIHASCGTKIDYDNSIFLKD